jgi:hypothetical protein
MKIIALWDTAYCSLVEVDRRLRGAYHLHSLSHEDAMREKSAANIGIDRT